MIRKAYKYRLYPTKEQQAKLEWVLERCRELYNAALQERKEAWKYAKKNISYYEQKRALPEIKRDIRIEYQDISSNVLQNVIERVDKAFQHFFRHCKHGEKPGYPRFQGRNRYDSFTYPSGLGNGFRIDAKYLTFPKLGKIRVKLHRLLEGKIKTATIKQEGDEWYVIFSCEVEQELLPVSYEDVGMDLGVSKLATLSNGEMIEHPRYYRKAEKTLAKRQQAASRKKRGSNRRKKAIKQLAKAHRKTHNQRYDFLHKESRKLVNRYQVIVFEDLQTGNLTKRPKPKQDEETGAYLPNGASSKAGLNTSINDASWGSFVSMCTYKAAWAGRTLLKVDPRFTSQVCSGCGQVRKKDLSERWHSCDCGAELDRDVNAAINILERGRRQQRAIPVEIPSS